MAALFAPPSPSQNRKQKEYVNGIIREFLIEYSADFLRSMAHECIWLLMIENFYMQYRGQNQVDR